MKAAVIQSIGEPEVFELADVARARPVAGELAAVGADVADRRGKGRVPSPLPQDAASPPGLYI